MRYLLRIQTTLILCYLLNCYIGVSILWKFLIWIKSSLKIGSEILLFHHISTYLCYDGFAKSSPLTRKVKHSKIQRVSRRFVNTRKFFLNECSHKGSDTGIFHALQQKENVKICSKYTDVFLLVVFAYSVNKTNDKRVTKVDSNKFINIRKIVDLEPTSGKASLCTHS